MKKINRLFAQFKGWLKYSTEYDWMMITIMAIALWLLLAMLLTIGE